MKKDKNEALDREALTARHLTEVYNHAEMLAFFELHELLGPFAIVTRRIDGKKGSLEFQKEPRYYYSFVPD
jgi:hypothetical protein